MDAKSIIKKLKRKWPLVWRRTFYSLANAKKGAQVAADRKLSSVRQSHREDRVKAVHDASRQCGEIVERASEIMWRRQEDREMYCVNITFDARMYAMVQHRPDSLEMMTQHLCDQLAYEIKKSRFAMPPERARLERNLRPQYEINKVDNFR